MIDQDNITEKGSARSSESMTLEQQITCMMEIIEAYKQRMAGMSAENQTVRSKN